MKKYKIWLQIKQPPSPQTTYDSWEVSANDVQINDQTGQAVFKVDGDIVAIAPPFAFIKLMKD